MVGAGSGPLLKLKAWLTVRIQPTSTFLFTVMSISISISIAISISARRRITEKRRSLMYTIEMYKQIESRWV